MSYSSRYLSNNPPILFTASLQRARTPSTLRLIPQCLQTEKRMKRIQLLILSRSNGSRGTFFPQRDDIPDWSKWRGRETLWSGKSRWTWRYQSKYLSRVSYLTNIQKTTRSCRGRSSIREIIQLFEEVGDMKARNVRDAKQKNMIRWKRTSWVDYDHVTSHTSKAAHRIFRSFYPRRFLLFIIISQLARPAIQQQPDCVRRIPRWCLSTTWTGGNGVGFIKSVTRASDWAV